MLRRILWYIVCWGGPILALFLLVAPAAASDLYKRVEVVTPGYYYRQGCYTYQYPATTSYSYTPYVAPVYAAPKPPPYSPDWKVEVVKYAAIRDDQQAYANALAALGIRGQSYSFQTAGYSAYPAVVQGSTSYGYMTYNSIKEAFGDNSLAAGFAAADRHVDRALTSGSAAQKAFLEALNVDGSNRSRVAEILAMGQASAQALQASKPQASSRTVTSGTGVVPSPTYNTKPMPNADPSDSALLQAFQTRIVPRCVTCHGPARQEGKFLIGNYPDMGYEDQRRVMRRVYTDDPAKSMPRKEDGSAGESLASDDIKIMVALQR